MPGRIRERRIDRAYERDAPDPYAAKHAPHDARLQRIDVRGDVRKLRHRARCSYTSIRRARRDLAYFFAVDFLAPVFLTVLFRVEGFEVAASDDAEPLRFPPSISDPTMSAAT